MKSNKILAVLTLLLFGYILSYVLIRNNHTYTVERDGCPPEGCTIVSLPQGKFYTFYKALIFFDEKVSLPTEFIFTDE